MSNAITQLAKIIKNKLVRTVNGGVPDANGNIDLSYMARLDKTNIFALPQTFAGGINATKLADNTDLNELTKTGFYTAFSNANVATMKNTPFADESFYMVVIAESSNYAIQIAWKYSGVQMVMRNFGTPEGTWNNWPAQNGELLWSGAFVPLASQTITPSASIYNCQNGWELTWEKFDTTSNTGQPNSFQHQFIHKNDVDRHPNGTHHMLLADILSDGTVSNMAAKKVFVSGTTIQGWDNNQNSAAAKSWVLAEVSAW